MRRNQLHGFRGRDGKLHYFKNDPKCEAITKAGQRCSKQATTKIETDEYGSPVTTKFCLLHFKQEMGVWYVP